MTEDIHEPVELYRTLFKEAHARNTSEYFEDLVRESGVDEHANIKTVGEMRVLEQQVANVSSTSMWWNVLRAVVIGIGLICIVLFATQHEPLWLIGPVGAAALVFVKLNPMINDVDERLRRVKQQRDEKQKEAWQQMAPLNQLYDWDIVARLIQRTVPRLEIDPYFANGRLNELRKTFGWDDQFNQGRSVVFAHSGVLNGNPFVLAQTLYHWMGSKTYHGSLNISWTEQVRDSNGKWSTVTRHQTLHASVNKPFPEYGDRKTIIFGNEAAPDLSFHRSPSKLSRLEDGMISNWRKRHAVKQLEAKSRDIGEGKVFTVMANREFDALFGATDRNHEVQFRLLFTPLAQQEMLNVLKDNEVGYGDDFEFTKQRMINVVEPKHMAATNLNADPTKFHAYELYHARKHFNEYHNDFFRSFFFGLAPLLVIPLYQQHRSHANIYKDVYESSSCFWEHETIANYFGEKQFQHPDCVTRSILKTQSRADTDGLQTVCVTAYGYKGIGRVEHVPVYGGDGRFHDVRVEWVEYLNVRSDTDMVVQDNTPLRNEGNAGQSECESAMWQTKFQSRGVEPQNAILRRSIVTALLPKQ